MDNKSYSKGICWIDDCRIPFVDESDSFTINKLEYQGKDWYKEGCEYKGVKEKNTQGRFPANILASDDMLNDGKLSISEGGKTKRTTAHFGAGTFNMEGYGDKGTNSRYYDIDKWFDKILND